MPLTLDQWISRLEIRRPEHKMLLGLDRIAQVLPKIVPAHKKIAKRVITVAGTNGKGSTVAFLEHIFKASEVNYGATCSPHLLHFNERIRINGCPVTDQEICDAFERVEKAKGDIFLSFFEFAALAAFEIFSNHSLDVAILEIGLGGRLDAMNVIDPDISVVTTVDLDHQAWLGNTIEEIAKEKAGIYRKDKPAIYGSTPVPSSLACHVDQTGAKPFFKDSQFHVKKHAESWTFSGEDYAGQQVLLENIPYSSLPFTSAVCAVQAALLLDRPVIKREWIKQGIRTASLFGRNHVINVLTPKKQNITVRFDVAHNPQAGKHLAEILYKHPKEGKRIALVSMLSDKDYRKTLAFLRGYFQYWNTFTISNNERALHGQVMKDYLLGLNESAFYHENLDNALSELLEKLKEGDELVVFGSFYTVAAVFQRLCSSNSWSIKQTPIVLNQVRRKSYLSSLNHTNAH